MKSAASPCHREESALADDVAISWEPAPPFGRLRRRPLRGLLAMTIVLLLSTRCNDDR